METVAFCFDFFVCCDFIFRLWSIDIDIFAIFILFRPKVVESPEEIPLNPTLKKQISNNNSNHGYDSAVDDAEKQLLNVTVPSGVDCNRLHTQKSERNGKAVSVADSATSTLLDAAYPVTNLHDINAMSIASIYDREDDDVMDADK